MTKTIYILWLQGFDNAPFLVNKCVDSWIKMNSSWNVVQLDKGSLNNHIDMEAIVPDLDSKTITNPSLSDLIRISLLKEYGGLWVDATTYCTTPLDNWLEEYIEKGFFGFSCESGLETKPDRLISSWFLYGDKHNLIIDAWYQATVNYFMAENIIGRKEPCPTLEEWDNGETQSQYFWFHYLFGDLYKRNVEFKMLWDQIPTLLESGPHFLQHRNMLAEPTKEIKEHIDFKKTPLYKLTHRYSENEYNDQCSLHYLLEPKLGRINIAATVYELRDSIPNIRFIHIGKCGGTSLLISFKDQDVKLHNYHLHKPEFNPEHQYIMWIRNPLHRFVSAFDFSAALINLETSDLDINNLTLENCLAPGRIAYKMNHDHTFSPEYDGLITFFKTPTNLAESLSDTDPVIREKAIRLMSHPMEHINQGIGWYLDDGEFIKAHKNNILFVGKVETMKSDLKKLSTLLNIPLSKEQTLVRENTSPLSKYLSPMAVKNLLYFYKETDYKAIEALFHERWIDESTYQSYFEYREQ